MFKERLGDLPPKLRRNPETSQDESPEVDEALLVIKSRMTKLEGKSRLSKVLFSSLSELDFSGVDSRQAVEIIRKACKEIEIEDKTNQVVDAPSAGASNLLRKIPTPHMLIRPSDGKRILVVPKDIDAVFIYHPVNSNDRKFKGAWVCGNIITI